jgi:hypothetical protein
MHTNEQEYHKQLTDLSKRLDRLEKIISKNTQLTKEFTPPNYVLGGMSLHNLSKRLAVTNLYLLQAQENMSTDEFLKWTRSRDPMNKGWIYASDGCFYREA